MTAKLIYAAITSLDGYIEDERGVFDWAKPDEEVHGFINDLTRRVGTHLYGRRFYETMKVWQSEPGGESAAGDYAEVWRAADKIVYSTTLTQVSTPSTRLERTFDASAVRALKADAQRDLSIGGAQLAAHAFRAGLVDEIHLFVNPIIVGGGKPALPNEIRVRLELVEARRFEASGVVHLWYRT